MTIQMDNSSLPSTTNYNDFLSTMITQMKDFNRNLFQPDAAEEALWAFVEGLDVSTLDMDSLVAFVRLVGPKFPEMLDSIILDTTSPIEQQWTSIADNTRQAMIDAGEITGEHFDDMYNCFWHLVTAIRYESDSEGYSERESYEGYSESDDSSRDT